LSRIKSLKKAIRDLSFEKEALQKSNDELHIKIDSLETKRQDIHSKCEGFEKLVLKFSKGQENSDKLLGSQRMSFNKKGIGYNPLTKKEVYKNFLLQWTFQSKSYIKCNYCLRNGHMSYSCPLRKSSPRLAQVWVPKGAKR